ncbi:UDP-glucoronosyl and UDP-glucosyl transferase [Teladorsagia circumcincta]|uniref:glucuronosyltransferase n=1 Tax=Teladorsagia circumcincta TaxID=45464 RepID=A0A2G9U8K5_TELCI|nr:UDP-glucoronosyl and UDP-glucosyl transferase [Teladorsagia circumcincta]
MSSFEQSLEAILAKETLQEANHLSTWLWEQRILRCATRTFNVQDGSKALIIRKNSPEYDNRFLGHDVHMWTQMEMAMLDTGNNRLPPGVTEYRIPIEFKDKLKTEGLKVFQSLMFSAGDAYDLWWTGQEFKDMRVEACAQMLEHDPKVFARFREEKFDLAIAHFHDLCPLAIARKIGVKKVVWITHGTSIYDFAAVQLGLRTLPASVPHPLSSAGFTQTFTDRVFNLLWHLSLLDFVNLPQNLLHDENQYYRNLVGKDEPDLWELSRNVPALLINGERMLDFPRPLPIHITAKKVEFDDDLRAILQKPSKGLIVFSLGTVSNTTNMPQQMIAGVPAVLMPLFADQKINAMRAQRFGIARVLDKLNLAPEIVYDAIADVLENDTPGLCSIDAEQCLHSAYANFVESGSG